MAIPSIEEQYINAALKYIDENGMPPRNQSTKYELVTDDGKRYPPKYVIAVARHLATGQEIAIDDFNAVEAKNFLLERGYTIEPKQPKKYELTISAESITSTDDRFTMDNLSLGNNYKPLNVLFKRANGEEIKRIRNKSEKRNTNQTLPRLACQVFEKQLVEMSVEDKEKFPICKYGADPMIRGIYTSTSEYQQYRNRKTIDYLTYKYDNGRQFVFYCWNIFSTIIFVQECLKRFGDPGDKMILIYREKDEQEKQEDEAEAEAEVDEKEQEDHNQRTKGYQNPFSSMLIVSKNLIFRGAPGTGKSYLAKEIAADIISDGYYDKYDQLSDEQKHQVEFVQFHPSYDYSNFVEGLRPKVNDDGTMGFELQDGIFKKFVARARKDYEDSKKSKETIEKELSVQEAMNDFFSSIELGVTSFKTINGSKFTITSIDDRYINIWIPGNKTANKLSLSVDEIGKMLEANTTFAEVKDITKFFGKLNGSHAYSYEFVLYTEIKKRIKPHATQSVEKTEPKKYIFIIDEINRGEISKIFGELFYSIDPGYRGHAGEISTQYANLHSDPDEKFYIPENVYIIGTMNDIDRSVDSFDFAMRRRFRFVELKADERLEMLASLKNEAQEAEAIKRMTALNKEIVAVEDLNENYQIGASYFLKLKTLSFDQLWTDYLEPLLKEYVQGMYDEESIMKRFAKAYGYEKPTEDNADETVQDQG